MIFKKTIDSGLKKVLAIHHNEDGQLLAVWLTAIMAMGSVFMGTAYDMSNAWGSSGPIRLLRLPVLPALWIWSTRRTQVGRLPPPTPPTTS